METERLVFRRWAEDDVDALAPIFAEPAVRHFPFGRGFSRLRTWGAGHEVPLLAYQVTSEMWDPGG